MQPIFWLAALILFGVGEAVTVGLTSIWFALGSLGALIVSSLGFGFWPQFITFVVLSAISMALLRPIARKLLKPNYSATNAQVWSARSSQADGVIPAGQEVRVLKIQGVKVIVEPV